MKQAEQQLTREEQKQALRESVAKHRHRMETDPEYKALWERRAAELEKFTFVDDGEN